MHIKDILSILLGLMGIAFTMMMFVSRNTVKTAYYLVLVFVAFSGFYFLLEAYFIGFVQLIVYAGAIMVMVLFTLNYFSAQQEIQKGEPRRGRRWFAYLLAVISAVLLIGVFAALVPTPIGTDTAPKPVISAGIDEVQKIDQSIEEEPELVRKLSKNLFSKFLLPFELTSVIILLAMVGAIYLTWNRRGEAELEQSEGES